MLGHLIQRTGNGGMVVVVPLIISCLLFIAADVLSINDKNIGAITLISSSIVLFLIDRKQVVIKDGDIIQRTIKLPRVKRNTLMWIEVRYWAFVMAISGFAMLSNAMLV